MSNNGFSTLVWGPALWTFLHCVSLNYPLYPTQTEITHYFTFMISLGDVLPCGICREQYMNNLIALKFSRASLVSRDSFAKFMYNLHRYVADRTQGTFKTPYLQLRRNFELFRANDCYGERGCLSKRCRLVQRIVRPEASDVSFKIDPKCVFKD